MKRFQVDQSISPFVPQQLSNDGHDPVHVSSIGLRDASDKSILQRAIAESRVIVSVDTDFGRLVTSMLVDVPSVVLFRKDSTTRR